MGKASRRKGAEGEQAVARLFREAGWDVRGVQRGAADAGDLLATRTGTNDRVTALLDALIHDSLDGEPCPDCDHEVCTFARDLRALLASPPRALVLDSKRQERIRVLEWSRQVEGIALAGEVPAVVWRPSREPWRVSLRLDDLLGMLG